MFSHLQNLGINKKIGYKIKKSLIDKKDYDKIIKQLTLTPKVHKDFANNVQDFECFFEDEKYIYLPKFWALKNIGKPKKNLIKRGDYFKDPLTTVLEPRDYQVPIIDKTFKQLKDIGGGIISVGCGAGKCQSKDTPILMYDGTIKKVQDIKVGDKLMGDDSTPRNVLSLARGREMMYKIIPKKGTPYTVNESHILSLKCSTKCRFGNKDDVFDISLKDYLKLPKMYHGRGSPICGYKVGVEFPEKKVYIDPYDLGLWLGDGHSHDSVIENQDAPIIKYLFQKVKDYECYLQYRSSYTYSINSINNKKNNFSRELKKLNLIKNKHIPHIYKCNSRENRLKLLAGLIDTDGYKTKDGNMYSIIQKNEKLLDDIVYLSLSLGFYAEKRIRWKKCTNCSEPNKKRKYFQTSISGFGIEEIPVKIKRKKCEPRKQIKNPLNSLITVKKLEVDDYYGFTLDGNHRYLLGDFTVTHNTFMAIRLATLIKQKTLIIVHSTVLQDQWIDRIQFFIPQASIGIIKGKVFDIEGKDFVIAMLQTLVNPRGTLKPEDFSSFGFTCFDEAHHLAAPSFSKCFPLVSSKYNLGLSATPKRSDNLQNVFYWNIGPPSWEEKSKGNGKFAIVKNINYNDDTYVEKYKWNGSIDLHKLTKQIIENDFRNNYIVTQLKHLAKTGRQTLVLSNVINHLKDLKTKFESKKMYKYYPRKEIFDLCKQNNFTKKVFSNICSFLKVKVTCGMYVGGMKQSVDTSLNSKTHKELDEIIIKNIDKINTDEIYSKIFNKNGKIKKKINLSKEEKVYLLEDNGIEIKEDDSNIESLEKSAKSDVLFASYQLVSEGTDIPTLNTLVMISPKKEVEQVVGRILRAKTNFVPMIVDITDSFGVYQNQARYRQRYYRKCKYPIFHIDITNKDEKIDLIDDNFEENSILTKLKKKKKNKKKEKNNEIEIFEECLL